MIDEALDILERNGADRVRTWAKMHVLLKVLDKATAAEILYYLQQRPDFTERFVSECLPPECLPRQPRNLVAEVGFWGMAYVPFFRQGFARMGIRKLS